jgi:FAD/FMN-containing dehydrogenase
MRSTTNQAAEAIRRSPGGGPFDEAAFRQLARSFRGQLIRPADDAYGELRRVWNGAIDRYPALIARCDGVADVIEALRFGRRSGLPIAVRGGGHSFPGLSVVDDGVVIDLGPMKGVRVDPTARVASVEGGVLIGELDRETQRSGLAVPAGFVSHTGVAGLALGGGIGWLHRKHGLTIDQFVSVDVVTADGDRVTASPRANADLFWGLRGGGGNFGIATEFQLNAHPVGPHVVAGPIFWRLEEAQRVLGFYREWIGDAPDELTTIVLFRQAPDLPFIPRELVGRLVVGVVCCYAGSIEEGERALAPLKAFGPPTLDLCTPKPFVDHQQAFDRSYRHGCWYYVKACDVAELSDGVIDTAIEFASRISSPITSVAFWQMGGAVARVDEANTAFGGRGAAYTVNINGNSETADDFDEQREWARAFWAALSPWHSSVYVNFLMDDGDDRIRQAYGSARLARLTSLKRRYDPHNVFRGNQNISPDTEGGPLERESRAMHVPPGTSDAGRGP